MIEAFMHHQDIDVTVLNDSGEPPIQRLAGSATDRAKTLNWVRVFSHYTLHWSYTITIYMHLLE